MTLLNKKKEKTYSTKKLPGLFKKKYTEKKLNKKLLNKLFIPADKEYIDSLFITAGNTKKGTELFAISKESTFTKKELTKLKKLAKEIKKQKTRVKFIPLIATLAFIFCLISAICLTKNIIVKKIIINTVQSITEARCDVRNVDIRLLDSTFKLEGLEVADKDSPMKNIFSISSITFDFDMLQLLKSRFVANELSVNGIEIGSDRTYSGKLPPRKAKKIKKQKEKAEKKEKKPSPLMEALQEKSKDSLNTVQKSLEDSFAQFRPENLFTNFYKELKTPPMAEKVQKEVEALIEKYKALPDQLEKEVKKGEDIINDIKKIDLEELIKDPVIINSPIDINMIKELQKFQDPEELKKPENIKRIIEIANTLKIKNSDDLMKLVEIKPSVKVQNTIDKLTNAYNYAMDMEKLCEAYAKDIQKDFNKTTKLTIEVKDVLTSDTKYVQKEIKRITSFRIDDGVQFISGTFDSLVCQLLGKYYPYAVQAADYLAEMKNNKKEKPAKKTVIKTIRAPGRDIYYKNDKAPEFWIKKIAASGSAFSVQGLNITNNMDIIGKPATGDIKLHILGLDHNAKVVVDTRSKTKNPLVTADYNCEMIPVKLPVSYFNNTPGIPGIEKSNAAIDFLLNVYSNEGFDITGKSSFSDVVLNTISFEPSFVSDIYSNILAEIKAMDLSFVTGYTATNGFNLGIDTNIDEVFMAALQKELKKQLEIIKAKIEAEVVAKINELTNGMFGEITSFDDIRKKVEEYVKFLQKLPAIIEAKKNQLENLVKKTIENTEKQLRRTIDMSQNMLQAQLDNAKEQLEKTQKQIEDELARQKKAAEEELEKQKKAAEAELERQRKAAEAELEKKKKEAEAEAARLKKKAEEEARKKAEELEKQAKEKAKKEAVKNLKKLF